MDHLRKEKIEDDILTDLMNGGKGTKVFDFDFFLQYKELKKEYILNPSKINILLSEFSLEGGILQAKGVNGGIQIEGSGLVYGDGFEEQSEEWSKYFHECENFITLLTEVEEEETPPIIDVFKTLGEIFNPNK